MNFKKIKLGHSEDIIVYGRKDPKEFYIKLKFNWNTTHTKIKSADVELVNATKTETDPYNDNIYELFFQKNAGGEMEYEGGHICIDTINNGLYSHVFEIYLIETGEPKKIKTNIVPKKDMMMKASGSFIFVNIIAHESNERINPCNSYIVSQEFDDHPETIGGSIIVSI